LIDMIPINVLVGRLTKVVSNSSTQFKHFVAAGTYRKDGKFVSTINGHPRHNVVHACHAEMRLLRKSAMPEEIYIIRLNKRNELLNSLPCSKCTQVLRKRGTRTIVCCWGSEFVKVEL